MQEQQTNIDSQPQVMTPEMLGQRTRAQAIMERVEREKVRLAERQEARRIELTNRLEKNRKKRKLQKASRKKNRR